MTRPRRLLLVLGVQAAMLTAGVQNTAAGGPILKVFACKAMPTVFSTLRSGRRILFWRAENPQRALGVVVLAWMAPGMKGVMTADFALRVREGDNRYHLPCLGAGAGEFHDLWSYKADWNKAGWFLPIKDTPIESYFLLLFEVYNDIDEAEIGRAHV